ncbi:MAG TPA: DUF4190 domain-containing protein [Myxococcaceae bacterium]|nr:DUF4190 domain-containing protein [Myxococcaceae bacterium]
MTEATRELGVVPLPTRHYGLPIVALICAVVGILVVPLVVVGAILGFIAYRRIRREPDLKGRGLAIAAMAMPLVALPLYIVVLSVVLVPTLG